MIFGINIPTFLVSESILDLELFLKIFFLFFIQS